MDQGPGRIALAAAVATTVLAVVVVVTARALDDDFVAAPPPETAPDVRPPMERPLSVLSVPLEVPLGPLVELLESAVPNVHGDLEEFVELPERGRVRIAFELERAPFRASVDGAVARLETTVLYRLRMSYSLPVLPDVGGSCGVDELRPRLGVILESPLSLAPDWSLETEVRVRDVYVASDEDRDRCEVTFLGIDVTDLLADGVRSFLERSAEDIDALVAQVDTRSSFESWWTTLREPIELTDSLWLTIGPEGVRSGAIRGAGDAFTVDVALTARPSVTFGPRPTPPEPPLPRLDAGVLAPHLDLLVDARAEYGAASGFLMEQIAGDTVAFDGHAIVIDSLRVYGIGGGRVAMQVRLSGDFAGRVFLTGRPDIDPATGVISVPDLDFDVATRDVLLSTVAWLAGPSLLEDLRARARWPGDPAVAFLTEWLTRGLNRDVSDALRIRGSVDSVSIVSAHALTHALLVRISAQGTASLEVVR
jgi:hypothetical protein